MGCVFPKVCRFTLAVRRDFKNEEGIYETDFIKCVSRDTIAEKICEYCKKGDLVSVKGRIENLWEDNLYYEIIAEKLSFLSSSKGE